MKNVNRMAESLSEPWKPLVVADVSGFQMKVAMLLGTFPWHAHDEEDELFYCLSGSFRIELEGESAQSLTAGDVVVVPAGRRHRPVADDSAVAVVFERAETKQYGD
jgi:mannose-6-phosphate isomerase-like protein (cupin superfamily)